MATRKELLGSELIKEIVSIRIDTMWSMLALHRSGRLPPVGAEKATGDLDDKGGMFIPGGFVFQDWEGKPVMPQKLSDRSGKGFRRAVRRAMRFDGAHLILTEGLAPSVTLGNSDYAKMASIILESRREALRRSGLGDKRPERIDSAAICKSYCPTYVQPPYGSRTSLSSDLSACLTEPRMYFRQCFDYYNLRGAEGDQLWEDIKTSLQPVLGDDGAVLAPPFVVTCHNTRYRESSLTGLTRLSGFGKFGEFATLTLEQVSADLVNEVEAGGRSLGDDDLLADWEGYRVAGLLRVYPRTNPGARLLKGVTSTVVSAERDLGLDVARIAARSRKRYGI